MKTYICICEMCVTILKDNPVSIDQFMYENLCDDEKRKFRELGYISPADASFIRLVNKKPVEETDTPIWNLVIADMEARDNVGRERYGRPLTANNGRDALLDAYEEALDLAVYLKQAMVERDQKV